MALLPTVVIELLALVEGYGGKGEMGDKIGNELEGETDDVEIRNP